MMRLFEQSSSTYLTERATIPEGMVRPAGETSNSYEGLFEELEAWEEQLKHVDLDVPEVQP